MHSTISSFAKPRNRGHSHLALAVALATGTALSFTAFAEPAYAQKKKKKDEAPQAEYSDTFRAIYPVMSKSYNEAPDTRASLASQVPALAAASTTPDDKNASGNLIYNIGVVTKDAAIQKQGLRMMLESGKADAERSNALNYTMGQIAYREQDYATARRYIETAIAGGYNSNDPELLLVETYFGMNENAEGLRRLSSVIEQKMAAGQPVERTFITRGLSVAVKNQMVDQANEYSGYLVQMYPSVDSWGDAIAVQRNYADLDPQETLDLMRLATRTGSLRSERDYLDYIVAADPRRLPGEVERAVSEGVAAGKLNASDPFVVDVKAEASRRVQMDRTELPGLERDARAGSAKVATIMSAGDAFLSYNEPAKAEEFYRLALAKPGVDTPRVMTRLGIAQFDQGNIAGARETFAKVDGARKAIASLWGTYAAQEASGTATGSPDTM